MSKTYLETKKRPIYIVKESSENNAQVKKYERKNHDFIDSQCDLMHMYNSRCLMVSEMLHPTVETASLVNTIKVVEQYA